MRVLHLDTGLSLRGGQHQLLALLGAMGPDASLLAPARSPTLKQALALGFDARPISAAAILARSRDAALVHCHDARSHTLAALFSRAPFVVSRRVAFPVKRGLLSRWKYARAARFLAVSHAVFCRLLRAGIPEAKIDIVPDGVALPPRPSTRTGPILALYSGDPLKGGDLLRRTHLDVHFTSDLPALLPEARLFLHISESEGLGSAALLALAHGVPVVASSVGGLPEIVIPGHTGLLVRNHPADILAAARRILDDETLASSMAANARALVERRFTIERMLRLTLDSYSKVVPRVVK
ncbi:MAG: glycosyltransferase family 4 protein [Candidatus Solibacter usitatus]|nr:glycosyltransferase family 4 protein [Candidatus Solibacter usitatus]